jgi:hypothetical protein
LAYQHAVEEHDHGIAQALDEIARNADVQTVRLGSGAVWRICEKFVRDRCLS